MKHTKNKGFKRIVLAFKYSCQGIVTAMRSEAAFRQEMVALLVSIPLAAMLAGSFFQFVLLVASVLFVLVVELVNSAIEALTDRIGTEHHELSGNAKDMGSAAVLLSIAMCLMLWVAVLLERVSTM